MYVYRLCLTVYGILVYTIVNSILAILGLWHNEKHNLDMQTYKASQLYATTTLILKRYLQLQKSF